MPRLLTISKHYQKEFFKIISRVAIKFHENSLIFSSTKEMKISENSSFSMFSQGVDILNPSLLTRHSSNRRYTHRRIISRATHQSRRVLRDRDHAQRLAKKKKKRGASPIRDGILDFHRKGERWHATTRVTFQHFLRSPASAVFSGWLAVL